MAFLQGQDRIRHMVEDQLQSRDIDDKRVLGAFLKVPRHEFVLPEYLEEAYNDYPLPIGLGQTISQPYMVALMVQVAELKGNETVLEIGTGSGYGAAILSKVAKKVVTIERVGPLAEKAKKILKKYKNVKVIVGDGSKGHTPDAPYDAIIVTAYARNAPEKLIEQLKENGRLVIPLGNTFSQDLMIITKQANKLRQDYVCGCRFVPLVEDKI